jgi:hypothetical protein
VIVGIEADGPEPGTGVDQEYRQSLGMNVGERHLRDFGISKEAPRSGTALQTPTQHQHFHTHFQAK